MMFCLWGWALSKRKSQNHHLVSPLCTVIMTTTGWRGEMSVFVRVNEAWRLRMTTTRGELCNTVSSFPSERDYYKCQAEFSFIHTHCTSASPTFFFLMAYCRQWLRVLVNSRLVDLRIISSTSVELRTHTHTHEHTESVTEHKWVLAAEVWMPGQTF